MKPQVNTGSTRHKARNFGLGDLTDRTVARRAPRDDVGVELRGERTTSPRLLLRHGLHDLGILPRPKPLMVDVRRGGSWSSLHTTRTDHGAAPRRNSQDLVCHERWRPDVLVIVVEDGAVQLMKVWPFGVALRGEAPNHLMLRRPRGRGGER